MRSGAHDVYIDNEIKKFAQLIPMYLVKSNFYLHKGIDLTVHLKFKLHSKYNCFEIIHVNNIPEQHEETL